MPINPIDGFEVDPASLVSIGHDLQRPECILAEADGTLWSADARGGVVRISPSGEQTLIVSGNAAPATAAEQFARIVNETLPNGMAFARTGDILIANFGTDRLELMKRSTGESEVLYDNIDGRPLGRVNFVLRDSRDRLWLTVSTRLADLTKSMTPSVRDGYIALADDNGIRIVADGLHFTNEIRFDAKEEWLYAVETCGMRVTRFRVATDGTLNGRETYGPDNHGRMIDGIAFDSFGNLWGTHIFTDRIFAITPDGDLRIILDDDRDSEAGRQLLQAYAEERLTPELMLACGGTVAPWMASITFGGSDLSNVYIGSLRGTTIPFFRSPVAGAPPVHWADQRRELR